MSTTDLSRVADILRVIYRHVQTLEEFADNIVFREGQKAVPIEQDDTDRFKTFVRGVFVCADKQLQQVPSCNQVTFLIVHITLLLVAFNSCIVDKSFVMWLFS